MPEDKNTLKRLLKQIEKLSKLDYTVKLGSILEDVDRKFYIEENFKFLKTAIKEKLTYK